MYEPGEYADAKQKDPRLEFELVLVQIVQMYSRAIHFFEEFVFIKFLL